MKVVKGINPKGFHHKEKNFFFYLIVSEKKKLCVCMR